MQDFVKSHPPRASVTATHPPQITFHWDGFGDEPGAIVGDAVHNIRTALDLMASELARRNHQSDKSVYFPFANSEDELPQQIKSKNFERCGQAAVTLLKSIAPYHGGNTLLRALHDLDVQDKHKALIIVPSTLNLEFELSYNIDNPANQTFKGDAQLRTLFPEDSPLAGIAVVKVLQDMVELVESILEAFARCLPSDPP
jgi:hypothetical protein